MIETRTLITQTKLEPSDLLLVLLKLSAEGWKPALLESQRAFLQMAGVADKISSTSVRQSEFARRFPPGMLGGGDVFFQEQDMYYIITYAGGRALWDRYGGRFFYRGEEGGQPELKVGVVSPDSSKIVDRLRVFVEMIENAIKSSLDGRKTAICPSIGRN
ncbi:MAG: hypothetical protein K6U74_05590 [Firmicutes bacterium]|nr:hypothetical protein [Bacillota bacterium]